MMNIIALTLQFPCPSYSGTDRRSLALLTQIAEKHSVHLVSFKNSASSPSDYSQLQKVFKTIHVLDHSHKNALLPILSSFFSRLPYKAIQYSNQDFFSAVAKVFTLNPIDLIFVGHPFLSHFIFHEHFRSALKVIDAPNLEFDLINSYTERGSFFRKIYGFFQYRKLKSYEISSYEKADGVITVSESDRERLISLSKVSSRRVTSVENGVDTQFFNYRELKPARHKIIFSGSYGYPNRQAVRFFVKHVFKRVSHSFNDLEFFILGDMKTPDIKKLLSTKNVFATGPVPDIREYMQDAWISVVPLFTGGGTRLKILEAMSMGIPVISTLIGCSGLNLEPEHDILIANNADDFIRQINRLKEDPDLYNTIALNARKKVETTYDWLHIGKKLIHFLDEVANQRKLS